MSIEMTFQQRRTGSFAERAGGRSSAHAEPVNLRTEPRGVRIVIVAMAVIFLSLFVVLPLVVVFAQAFSHGVGAYLAALTDPEALAAIRLTLVIA